MARELHVEVSSACIGSGTCRRLLPTVFGRDDERRAVVLMDPVEQSDRLDEAMDRCPVEAISARDAATGETVFP